MECPVCDKEFCAGLTDEQIDEAWTFSTGGTIVTDDTRAFARNIAALATTGLSGSPAPTEPSGAHRALRALIAHWHEFGPEHGFDEMIDAAIRATTRDAAEQPKGSK